MKPTTADAGARAAALDPTRSFIVQAPAGSGKTELLIQRFLTLLARVDEPEQIIGITFTRKAAAEMRTRIMAALREAREDQRVDEPHRQITRDLADRVLARDGRQGWEITSQPQRIRVETIDALNARLARQLPVLAGGAAGSSLVEDATAYYQAAAKRAIEGMSTTRSGALALGRVLEEHDANVPRLERMIADLLSRRDQWLAALAGQSIDELHDRIAEAVRDVLEHKLAALLAAFTERRLREIAPLLAHGARHAVTGALRDSLAPWEAYSPETQGPPLEIEHWRGVAALLLTQKGELRRRVDKREGFGTTQRALRDALTSLIEGLHHEPDTIARLIEVSRLPDAGISADELDMLTCLRKLLVRAAAELRIGFSADQTVDFIELATAASEALGRVEEPSELLLALDRRIQHILVDEFQDTSRAQYGLLEQLTSGWQPDDARTLFLVGDPMQSIYRFRNADMALFLRARRYGLADVRCEAVELSANFRSARPIVDWINSAFANVFPAHDDFELGLARFHPSEPIRPGTSGQFVQCHALESDSLDAELDEVVATIRNEREAYPGSSIGVLVQSRTHLAGLRAKLRLYEWPVRAVEIDALHSESFVQDLIGLCRAMCHLGDRIAWLSVLRAPWCGLCWRDMERLVGGDATTPVWALMHDAARLDELSSDGRVRLLHVRAILDRALETRALYAYPQWIERIWLTLDGPATLRHESEVDKADQFFACLDRAAIRADIGDPVDFEHLFHRPQREPDQPGEGGIDIMTIHRAKGLEFDTVILSSLNRIPRRNERPALHVLAMRGTAGSEQLLLAPEMRASSRLGTYVTAVEADRESAERARLLYVATTRARERLHLIWGLGENASQPTARSLLGVIWPQIKDEPRQPASQAGEEIGSMGIAPVLRRFADLGEHPADSQLPTAWTPLSANRPVEIEYAWAGDASAHIGTVVHRHLHLITRAGGVGNARPEQFAEARIRAELELLGVEDPEIDDAVTRVIDAIQRVLADKTGRWILGPHASARSEMPISVVRGGRLTRLRLDRTFVDDEGVRWIVDYKTGRHEGGQTDAFLSSEVERYRVQIEDYARAMSEWETRPIKVALYFPMLQAFRAWSPELTEPRLR